MISTQPGFVVQLKDKLIYHHYMAATIFIDHFSGLRYIHMMINVSSKETLQAKLAFEQYTANNHVALNTIMPTMDALHIAINGSNANAHFQNGIVERAI